jgi:hypothetical protein
MSSTPQVGPTDLLDAQFLTEPKHHEHEIRAYVRDLTDT